MPYQNPILPGFYPDPSICRVGEDFYLVTSSFQYYPGVPIFHSKNLVNWQQLGHVLNRPSQLPLAGCRNSGGIYAPTLRWHEGVFYMATTLVDTLGNFFVTATNPAGPWSEPIPVAMGGIDPTIFFDEDGSAWFLSTHTPAGEEAQISAARLDLATGALLSEPCCLWHGTGGKCPEGPHLYQKDGWYYLLIAEGGTETGHCVTMARSKNLTGPYVGCPRNPIFTHRARWEQPLQGTGHMDLVEDGRGNWWAVFLAFRETEPYFHHLGRETMLAPVQWPTGDFPHINADKPVTPQMDCDRLPGIPAPQRFDFAENFTGKRLKPDWNFLREQAPVSYHCDEKGGLTLAPNAAVLDTPGTPAFMGVRQRFMNGCFTATLQNGAGCVAGITAYYDNTRHFDLLLQENTIILRKRFDDFLETTILGRFEGETVTLCISFDAHRYGFGYGTDATSARKSCVDRAYTRHLATETGPISFTGVYLGLFAEGMPKSAARFLYAAQTEEK